MATILSLQIKVYDIVYKHTNEVQWSAQSYENLATRIFVDTNKFNLTIVTITFVYQLNKQPCLGDDDIHTTI